jgi:sucrose-6-phosphate hydrolase SacC (GH32 family)
VELGLRTTADGVRMVARPVREIERLHEGGRQWKDLNLPMGRNPVPGVEGELFHIRVSFRPGEAKRVGFVIRGIEVAYDAKEQRLTCLDKAAPMAMTDGLVRLELLADRTSIEVFGDDGRVYMPMGTIPPDDDKSLQIFAEAVPLRVETLEVHTLRSAWR